MDGATEGYVAWNGERYAGDPPAGWYLAADRRWWPEKDEAAEPPDSTELDAPSPDSPESMRAKTGRYGRAARRMADQVAQAKPVQAASEKAAETARQVVQAKPVQAASEKAAETARQVVQAKPVQAASEKAAGTYQAVASNTERATRSVGLRAGHGRSLPSYWLPLIVLLGLGTVVATVPPWIALDFGNTAAVVGDSTLLSLVSDRFVRYSTYDMIGIGFVLLVLSLIGTGSAVFAITRRARIWLIVSLSAFTLASLVSGFVVSILLLAQQAYQWVLPDDWSDYNPEVAVKMAAYGYVLASVALAIGSLVAFRMMRPMGASTPVSEGQQDASA